MAQPVILNYDEKDVMDAPVTSTEAIVHGDLVDITSSGYIYKMDSVTDDATFVGVALDSSADGDTANVAFAFRGFVEIDVLSGSYQVGAGLKYSAANSLVDDGGANTIAWAAEQNTSTTRLKVFFDAPALNKKFENNA